MHKYGSQNIYYFSVKLPFQQTVLPDPWYHVYSLDLSRSNVLLSHTVSWPFLSVFRFQYIFTTTLPAFVKHVSKLMASNVKQNFHWITVLTSSLSYLSEEQHRHIQENILSRKKIIFHSKLNWLLQCNVSKALCMFFLLII